MLRFIKSHLDLFLAVPSLLGIIFLLLRAYVPNKKSLLLGAIIVLVPLIRHSSVVWGQFTVRAGEGKTTAMIFVVVGGAVTLVTAISAVLLFKLPFSKWVRQNIVEALKACPIYICFLYFSIVGLIVGFVSGNEPLEVISGTFNVFQAPIQFLLVYLLVRITPEEDVNKFFNWMFLLFGIAGIGTTLVSIRYFGSFNSAAGGPQNAMLLLYALYFIVPKPGESTWRHVIRWVAVFVGVIVLIGGLKRAVWLGSAVAIMAIAFYRFGKAFVEPGRLHLFVRYIWVSLVSLAVACTTLVLSWPALSTNPQVQGYAAAVSDRIEAINVDELDSRRMEVQSSLYDLKTFGSLTWLFGRGDGAAYVAFSGPRGGQLTRDLHITPAAIFYRYGILGILLFTVCFILTWYNLIRRGVPSRLKDFALAYFLVMSVAMMGAYVITWDNILASSLAGVFALDYSRRVAKPREVLAHAA